MKVIKIDETHAILVKGWWFWKRQAEVHKVYEYMGRQGWKYTHTDKWVVAECHTAIMKAYKTEEPKPAPYTDGNPWVPVPKQERQTKQKLPKARVLSLTSSDD